MKTIFAILLFIFPFVSEGQLITNPSSPAGLVQNVLLGNGVTVSNITFNGSPISIGSFTAAGTNLGLASGIVMTTGTILAGGNGPQGPNNQEGAGMDNGAGGFPPLNGIAGNTTTNAAVLQFDFVPFSDSVKFNYVFASEEWLEYVNTGFNDAFAFFISGPGIAGQQNIARLPNGQTVEIDNVHSGGVNVNGAPFGAINTPFYVNNSNGATIQYDGFTSVLTAESAVQCGQTYHLIIAIADAGDALWDSGIFLEANSLESNGAVTLEHTISQNLFNNPSIIAEDCVTATVTLDRGTNNINTPLTIPINLSGSAVELVDYTDIPNSITFPSGVSQVQFTFNAFQDGLTEGQENIIFSFPIVDPCGNINDLILEILINDVEPVEAEIVAGQIVCPGEEIELVANATGGGLPYTYLWSTGETTQSIFVTPTTTQTYSVTVTDNCLNEFASDFNEIVVPTFPPLVLNETADITEICPYIPALLESNVTGGLSPYSYQWSSNFEPDLGTDSNINVIPPTTTTYTVVVTDFCGVTASADIVYTITSPPLTLQMSPTVEICPGDSIQISVAAQGGFGQYFYQWWHSGETTPTVWEKPGQTTTYTVSVSDECQTFTVEGSTQVVVVAPTADFTITSQTIFNNLPIQFQNLSQNATTYQWYFGDGNQSTNVHPQNTYSDPGLYYITLIAIDDKGCIDSITKPINIEEEWYIYVPNTFLPNGGRINSVFEASIIGISQLTITVFNRWGEVVFTSNEPRFTWDGTYKGGYVTDGTYTWKIDLVTNSGRQKNLVGHVNVLK